VELQASLPKIRARGLGLAAVSYDSPAVLKSFAERRGIAYPLLSDPESKVIVSYGLLNLSVAKDSAQFGIPYPGTFILDTKERVVAKYFEQDFRQRYTASDILVREFGAEAGGAAQSVETNHLRLTSSASPTTVHAGQRIALALDIELKPGMHVYAPGAQGYIPIEWKIAETPAYTAHAPVYPAPVKLYLKPIKETVPVFRGKFRLTGDLTVGQEAQVRPLLDGDGNLTIEGTLRYQACDERTCYTPQTAPLKWNLRYEALDRQRAPAELQRKAPAK
jgi:hypothetical protein